MKCFTSIAFFFTLLIFIFSSCQKNLTDAPVNGTDSSVFRPKQMIVTYDVSSTAREKIYYNFKYAPNGQQIDLYIDDTTSTNPYDSLSVSYVFNNAGYIISNTVKPSGARSESYETTINRASDNKIISIIMLYKRGGIPFYNDTSRFNYDINGTQTKIIVFVKEDNYNNGIYSSTNRDTVTYTYSSSNTIQQVKIVNVGNSSAGVYNCSYNPTGSMKTISFSGIYYNSTVDLSYNSGLPDSKHDFLAELLLGKDYYLQNIRDFPSVTQNYGTIYSPGISLTDPYHLTNIHVSTTEPNTAPTADYTRTYQMNKYQLPLIVTESSYRGNIYEFRY